jgi:class 3 adenylate cyclase
VFGKLVSHAAIYLAVCTTLSLLWIVMGHGTMEDLSDYADTPSDALEPSFWPGLVWLLWGTAVAIHAAVVVGRLLRPSYWSRQMRATRHLQARGLPRAEAMLTAASDAENRRGRRRRPSRHAAEEGSGRRHVVAMFTDIAGSTTINEQLGDEGYAALLANHRGLVRELTAEYDGTEVNTAGDGFFVRFDDATKAVACAIVLQRSLADQRANDPAVPRIRIGIHLGDAMQADGDVLGNVVNVAARLMQAGDPDEILLSEPVADAVDGVPLTDRGLVDLKGLSQPRHLLAVNWA